MLKTKIIATLGPACDSEQIIEEMIKSGVTVFRFNTKHGDLAWHSERMNRVRKTAAKLKTPIAILMDLRGPELRVGRFKEGRVKLEKNSLINFIAGQSEFNDEKNIYIRELKLIKGLKPGSIIYMDDGYLETKVVKVLENGRKIIARIIEGGILKDNKGINFPASDIDLPSLIAKDLEFISMPAKKDIDFFGYSFVRNKKDILALKEAIKKQKLNAKVIAKIETKQAIDNFKEILKKADGIMVARGDLGIEIPLEKVPFYQKMMIKLCRQKSKPVIVATQMLESMIEKPRPTRAETADVANAVYDGADAIMLSAETASGCFPLKAIQIMAKIAEYTEYQEEGPVINFEPENLPELITFSAFELIKNKLTGKLKNKLNIKAFVVFTDQGTTARILSRFRPKIPIIAVAQDKQIRDQLCLSYGIKPVYYKFPKGEIRSTKAALQNLKKRKILEKGDKVAVIYGKQWGVAGETNTIRLEEIE